MSHLPATVRGASPAASVVRQGPSGTHGRSAGGRPGRRAAVLLAKRPRLDLAEQIAAGDHPRLDYLEIARRVDADILDFRAVDRSRLPGMALIRSRLDPYWGLAWLGLLHRRELHSIFAPGEDIGLRLGLLLRATRWRGRLTMVVHNAGTSKRRRLFHLIGGQRIHTAICFGAAQRRVLIEECGLPPERVHDVEHPCDHLFYRARGQAAGEYILSIGMESRDYPTLLAAARELPHPFRVVASGYSAGEGFAPAAGIHELPNVSVGSGYSYRELRELYANARFVVVPLKSVSYAAGINAVVEGMALGKAIVASASPGILDYVDDGVSGLVVPVGDADALRRACAELWENPRRAAAMGQHNRAWIERAINMERYVERVVELMMQPPSRSTLE